jgi:AcrR family transcriptional regulator
MPNPRKPRADAEQNRSRILASARRIYGEAGAAASLDAIATDAGVGNATLYRHFPSRADLYDSVLAARMNEVDAFLTECEAEPDAWIAVERYVRYLAAHPDNTFLEVLVTPPRETSAIVEERERIRVRVNAMLSRASELRAGYAVDDMNVFLFAHATAAFSPHVSAAATQLLLEDYLSGIRR